MASKKGVEKILNFIEDYSYLVDQDTNYFLKSINEPDKRKSKEYRKKSDSFHEAINKLIDKRL